MVFPHSVPELEIEHRKDRTEWYSPRRVFGIPKLETASYLENPSIKSAFEKIPVDETGML